RSRLRILATRTAAVLIKNRLPLRATSVATPMLTREGNPVVRRFLKLGATHAGGTQIQYHDMAIPSIPPLSPFRSGRDKLLRSTRGGIGRVTLEVLQLLVVDAAQHPRREHTLQPAHRPG